MQIKIHGELVKITGHKELEAVVPHQHEEKFFFINNFPELESQIATVQNYQKILDKEEVDINKLHFPIGKSDIKFVPVWVSGTWWYW